jgi:hypothetical protein
MTSKWIIKGGGIGIISGILLGLLFKSLQSQTGIKVYVLLLNIDFIPFLGEIRWSELTEFLFHLIISCMIGILFTFSIHYFNLSGLTLWMLAFGLTLPALLLYFPLSSMAIKEVPAPYDPGGITLWLTGHLVYIVSLPLLYQAMHKPKR